MKTRFVEIAFAIPAEDDTGDVTFDRLARDLPESMWARDGFAAGGWSTADRRMKFALSDGAFDCRQGLLRCLWDMGIRDITEEEVWW